MTVLDDYAHHSAYSDPGPYGDLLDGDGAAERELAHWYAVDARLRPGASVRSYSPIGTVNLVDLRSKVETSDGRHRLLLSGATTDGTR